LKAKPTRFHAFLAAGCLDRLHVVVAPVIIGGPARFNLPIEHMQEALRAPMKIHRLDDEVLFDCDLSLSARRLALQRRRCDRRGLTIVRARAYRGGADQR
jgi:hypothetical protein